MVADLILVPVAADVVGDIRPGPEAVDLGALEEQEFFVGAPFSVEDRERVLFDYSVWMCCGLVGVARGATGEALYAEVVFIASVMGTSNPDLMGNTSVTMRDRVVAAPLPQTCVMRLEGSHGIGQMPRDASTYS
jgi:hypothetical protein